MTAFKEPHNDRKRVRTSAKGPATGYCGRHWRTNASLFGLPLIDVAFGRDESGRIAVAKGIIAIGRFAVGAVAFGQVSLGILSMGQAALGLLAVGQLAVGALAGFGQLSVGLFAVGQVVVGLYGMGQLGYARYLWSQGHTDMEAVAMFHTIKSLFVGEGPGGGQVIRWFVGLVRGIFSGK